MGRRFSPELNNPVTFNTSKFPKLLLGKDEGIFLEHFNRGKPLHLLPEINRRRKPYGLTIPTFLKLAKKHVDSSLVRFPIKNDLNHVVFNRLDESHSSAKKWKDLATKYFAGTCTVNAYLTPRKSQTLPRHYDTHDVFIVQLDGTKEWELFPKLDTPIEWRVLYAQSYRDKGRGTKPAFKISMEPGAVLYIPAGTPHRAYTNESSSLHIALGISPLCIFDVLESQVLNVLEKLYVDPRMAKRLSRNRLLSSPELNDYLLTQFEKTWKSTTIKKTDTFGVDRITNWRSRR